MFIPNLLCSSHDSEWDYWDGDDLDQDDTVEWTPRETEQGPEGFDNAFYDMPIFEYHDHLWEPVIMIHSKYCPCELNIFKGVVYRFGN